MELLSTLILSLVLYTDIGRATVYWPGDGHCGSVTATGELFTKEDFHVAHRKLPLGTSGILCSTTRYRCTRVSVKDRGPYGAIARCKNEFKLRRSKYRVKRYKKQGKCYSWQVQIRLKKGWRRRGSFDLTKPVAKVLGHKAFDYVLFIPLPVKLSNI